MTLALMSWALNNSLNSVSDQTFGGLPYTSVGSGGTVNPIGLTYTFRRGMQADVTRSAGGMWEPMVLAY